MTNTGPAHYQQAESLLDRAEHYYYGDGANPQLGLTLVLAALTHATLANAAANALPTVPPDGNAAIEWAMTIGMPRSDRTQRQDAEVTCDRHGGAWGDDMTCPRCTKIVGALVDERDIVGEVPGGYVVARDPSDPGPMPGEEEG